MAPSVTVCVPEKKEVCVFELDKQAKRCCNHGDKFIKLCTVTCVCVGEYSSSAMY